MKNKHSLVVNISSIKDIDNIDESTKYINLDITNCTHDVINYFILNGENYLYSDTIEGTAGYIYVKHDEFIMAENIIDMIYANMPNDLSDLEISRYLYIALAKYVFLDINLDQEKNENCSFSLISNVFNLWGSLAVGRVSDKSITKIYYYLCKRLGIDISIVLDTFNNRIVNKLKINNLVLVVDLLQDIPYIQASMKTKHFAPYNDDDEMDKKIKYIKSSYNDYYLDKSLKNIDYTNPDCVQDILCKTQKLIDIDHIKPVELSIIYNAIFGKYCPNYNIKINNLFLNNKFKKHFIMISYNDNHYSYNYQKKSFVKVNDKDILNNIKVGKIGLYLNEFIPNIKTNMNA